MRMLPAVRKSTRKGVYHIGGWYPKGHGGLLGHDKQVVKPCNWYERLCCNTRQKGEGRRCIVCHEPFRKDGWLP